MANEQTRQRIEDEARKRKWREMWESIAKLTGADTSVIANLAELGR